MKEISANIFEGRKRLSDILRYVMNSAPHGRCKRWEKSKARALEDWMLGRID